MRVGAVGNAATLARKYERRGAAEILSQRDANRDIALHLTRETLLQLGRDVYGPAPAPGHRRTGQLFRLDRWVVQQDQVRHRNTAPHYIHRWRYGKPGGRRAVPPRHASSWHRVALARNLRWILERRHRAHLRALERA